jgi:hypothetical protein
LKISFGVGPGHGLAPGSCTFQADPRHQKLSLAESVKQHGARPWHFDNEKLKGEAHQQKGRPFLAASRLACRCTNRSFFQDIQVKDPMDLAFQKIPK